MAYASEVELSGMGSVRSMRKQESHESIRGSVKKTGACARSVMVSLRAGLATSTDKDCRRKRCHQQQDRLSY
jgi:hypothetical protein